jgi:anti-anti-sigma regulatory factor
MSGRSSGVISRLACETRGDQLFLEGVIDESASLVELVGRAKQGRLIIDLHGITFINSLGVREWIRMQQAAANLGVRIELRRVAVPIVHQLNIMPATRGVSLVTSFAAPYECDECDAEHDMVLDVRLHGSELARMRAPQMACPECRRPMLFGSPPELYFSFLNS